MLPDDRDIARLIMAMGLGILILLLMSYWSAGCATVQGHNGPKIITQAPLKLKRAEVAGKCTAPPINILGLELQECQAREDIECCMYLIQNNDKNAGVTSICQAFLCRGGCEEEYRFMGAACADFSLNQITMDSPER